MITITIPFPGDPSFDERHGPATWTETLTSAHYVWEKAGLNLRQFEGNQSGNCAVLVRDLITRVLQDPARYISMVGYYDLRAVVTNLTRLFFTLRERPDGIVHVS